MSETPPTPTLGAHNLALLRRIAAAPHLQDDMAQVVTRDLVALLAAYDAQAARLAAAERDRDHAIVNLVQVHDRWAEEEQRATRLAAELHDATQAGTPYWRERDYQNALILENADLRARATRLAALEQAARAWAPLRKALLRRELLTMQRPAYAAEQEAAMDLLATVAALAAPPEETGAADAAV